MFNAPLYSLKASKPGPALPTPHPHTTPHTARDEHPDPSARFLAYASRVGRILAGTSRYSAYASDVEEAFRPVAPPAFVKATYALAFGYVGTDILDNGYRASEEGRSVPRAVAHATVFQGLASLAAPFAIIHTTVSATTKMATAVGSKPLMRYGPTMAGLAWWTSRSRSSCTMLSRNIGRKSAGTWPRPRPRCRARPRAWRTRRQRWRRR